MGIAAPVEVMPGRAQEGERRQLPSRHGKCAREARPDGGEG